MRGHSFLGRIFLPRVTFSCLKTKGVRYKQILTLVPVTGKNAEKITVIMRAATPMHKDCASSPFAAKAASTGGI